MEKKLTKNEKGITLVALIITIIVLLILAVVSIRAITGDNILGKAETAKNKYESAKKNEEKILGDYTKEINKSNKKSDVKYYIGIYRDDVTAVFRVNGNELKAYMGEKGKKQYLTESGNASIASLDKTVKVKINNQIHSFNKVAVNLNSSKTSEEEYEDNDLIIKGVHYSSTDVYFFSDTECVINEELNWYYEDISEEAMKDNHDITIYNLQEDFNDTLLSDDEE